MSENKMSPHRPSETKNAETTRAASAVLRDPRKRSALLDADYIRTPKASSPIPKHSPNFASLAVQLSVDPIVRTIGYVESLPALGRRVKVQTLVAEREDGRRFAYDLTDERPPRHMTWRAFSSSHCRKIPSNWSRLIERKSISSPAQATASESGTTETIQLQTPLGPRSRKR
jgi:hypothetical protein